MSFLSVIGLTKRFGSLTVFENVNAEIGRGEVVAIIGPSGTGKSTLLRAINMLEPPTSGRVVLDGKPISLKSDINAIRRKMSMVFQNFGLFSHLSVLDNVSLGQMKLLHRDRKGASEKSLAVLESVGLGERANFMPRQLSGGQKQRAAIARALAMEPEVILFDEPTSALDPTVIGEVTSVIRNLSKSGITMLIVTHEMKLARDISSRVFYMDDHGIYEEGPPDVIFDSPARPKTRDFINHVRSFNYSLASKNADFVEMLNGVENFCRGAGLDGKTVNRTRLIAEELVLALVMPMAGNCALRILYSDVSGELSLTAVYRGDRFDALENVSGEKSAAAAIVRNRAKDVRYDYINGENIITAVMQ
jgi:polar amino acid transport system ATP-binding protein